MTHTLCFEIGTEEIPAFDLHAATAQLKDRAEAAFKAARIPFSAIQVYSSPRRLILVAEGVADETESLTEVHKGPSAKIAFDADGNPTKAALGFARGKGMTEADLERREVEGVEYVFVTREIPAQPVRELLGGLLEELISSISWPKSCRWGTQSVHFSRPVRWLCALLDEEVIPVSFAGLTSNNETCGHRVLAPGMHTVPSADKLLDVVRATYVVPSEQEREASIRAAVATIEQETGCTAELPEKTLLEVINLCEYPTVLLGHFDEEFLQVPEEIIVDAMLMHQRYFPLYDANHKLTNAFIVVSNGDPAFKETIIDGNERVVRARLSDAKFFYDEDLKQSLESYLDRLDSVVFQVQLGTVRDKVERMLKLAEQVAVHAHLSEEDARDLLRAVKLCKCDLVTNAVVEFTSVQGIMGSYYATAAGETEQVAQAIGDHYRPRFSGDEAPRSLVGRLVAFIDKLDTICGLFAVNQGPSGSSDPFALRRSALGIIGMLEAGLPVKLEEELAASLKTYEGLDFDFDKTLNEIREFFITRTRVMLKDRGHSADVIEAVLVAFPLAEPALIAEHVQALSQAQEEQPEAMHDLSLAFARAHNLADPSLGTQVNAELLLPVEQALLDAVLGVEAAQPKLLEDNHYAQALSELSQLRGPIDAFFEEVKVMDSDQALRENRLRLLNKFVSVFLPVADFGKLAK